MSDAWADALVEAQRAKNGGDWALATSAAEQALRVAPTDAARATCWATLALAHMAAGDLARALHAAQEAARLDSAPLQRGSIGAASEALGDVLLARGELAAARSAHEALRDRRVDAFGAADPSVARAWLALSRVAHAGGDAPGAEAALERARELLVGAPELSAEARLDLLTVWNNLCHQRASRAAWAEALDAGREAVLAYEADPAVAAPDAWVDDLFDQLEGVADAAPDLASLADGWMDRLEARHAPAAASGDAAWEELADSLRVLHAMMDQDDQAVAELLSGALRGVPTPEMHGLDELLKAFATRVRASADLSAQVTASLQKVRSGHLPLEAMLQAVSAALR
jgi:tetratricopeptide (TPR) repeat protein